MMTRLQLSGVRSTNNMRCSKLNCTTGCTSFHRHHKASEHMFIRVLRHLYKTKRYKEMKARYEEFRDDDVVLICADHHEEIHTIYYNMVFSEIRHLGYRPVHSFTWEQVDTLMAKLVARCNTWLAIETPGDKRRQFVS